jgi:hypothetical protein
MDPAILLMLTVEKRLETGRPVYNVNLFAPQADPSLVEKRLETRRPVYVPRWDEPENVEPEPQRERNDLVKRILVLFRRQQPGECC